jgi:predicted metal-dependent phosphoesterase TrpH
MPHRQPFTALCQAAARGRHAGRADLHLHTTHSDGAYTPAQVVDLARRSGLSALAVTDHDTLGGLAHARAAAGPGLEVVAGVEITAEHRGREFHLLGYFFRPDDGPLLAALERLRADRAGRFWDMVGRLRRCGVSLDEEDLRAHAGAGSGALGRRHLAVLLVKARRVRTVREAFHRYLGDDGRVTVPKLRLAVDQAIALVRGAGGVAGWAHPPYDCDREELAGLRRQGLQAVEVDYPGHKPARVRVLRSWAAELGLAVTGGSDCHGPGHHSRAVGARGVTAPELETIRQLASG